MKSFKKYAGEMNKNAQKNTQNHTKNGAQAEEIVKRLASAYDGKSNADMLMSILAEAEKSKRAGTLSDAEIDSFYQSFSPMLSSSQREKLSVIVEKLKQI